MQCRGCEPACPSGVPYGHLIETTRTHLAESGKLTPWWQRRGLAVLPHHRLLLAGSTLLAIGQRLRLVPKRMGVSKLALRRGVPIEATAKAGSAEAWLFTGCVMDAWLRATHRSTAKVLDAMDVTYAVPGAGGGCCGALHAHAGLHSDAVKMATSVMAAMPGDAPILVNSAGCGAALKEYGHLVRSDDAERFAQRVFDVHEWIAAHTDRLPALRRSSTEVIVQDPCHLRHVQRAQTGVRTVLAKAFALVELDDDGLCCGAGGSYSVMEPELAGQIRDRKLEAIDRALARSGATVLASANPGCSMHLEAAAAERGLTVRHPIDLIAEALP